MRIPTEKVKCFHCQLPQPKKLYDKHKQECARMRQFECNICQRRFQSPQGVNRHKGQSHTAEERGTVHRCIYEDCDFGTDLEASLKAHMECHRRGFRRSTSRARSRSRSRSRAPPTPMRPGQEKQRYMEPQQRQSRSRSTSLARPAATPTLIIHPGLGAAKIIHPTVTRNETSTSSPLPSASYLQEQEDVYNTPVNHYAALQEQRQTLEPMTTQDQHTRTDDNTSNNNNGENNNDDGLAKRIVYNGREGVFFPMHIFQQMVEEKESREKEMEEALKFTEQQINRMNRIIEVTNANLRKWANAKGLITLNEDKIQEMVNEYKRIYMSKTEQEQEEDWNPNDVEMDEI